MAGVVFCPLHFVDVLLILALGPTGFVCSFLVGHHRFPERKSCASRARWCRFPIGNARSALERFFVKDTWAGIFLRISAVNRANEVGKIYLSEDKTDPSFWLEKLAHHSVQNQLKSFLCTGHSPTFSLFFFWKKGASNTRVIPEVGFNFLLQAKRFFFFFFFPRMSGFQNFKLSGTKPAESQLQQKQSRTTYPDHNRSIDLLPVSSSMSSPFLQEIIDNLSIKRSQFFFLGYSNLATRSNAWNVGEEMATLVCVWSILPTLTIQGPPSASWKCSEETVLLVHPVVQPSYLPVRKPVRQSLVLGTSVAKSLHNTIIWSTVFSRFTIAMAEYQNSRHSCGLW